MTGNRRNAAPAGYGWVMSDTLLMFVLALLSASGIRAYQEVGAAGAASAPAFASAAQPDSTALAECAPGNWKVSVGTMAGTYADPGMAAAWISGQGSRQVVALASSQQGAVPFGEYIRLPLAASDLGIEVLAALEDPHGQ